MNTYQVGTSKFEVYDPRFIHIGSVYAQENGRPNFLNLKKITIQ